MSHLKSVLVGAASLLALATSAHAADPELTVFDWAGWENPGLYADYVTKYGDGPTYSFFADDDEAFQKISSGFRADVGHPCSQMVIKYRDAGLIEPWDISKIPEFASITPSMLASPTFKDATGVWFIPTDGAFTAIAYNTDTVPVADVASLDVFLNPKYAGRISLPNNTDDVWSLALLATGVSDWSNITEDQFKAAADWLRKVHPNVRAYWRDPSELAQLMATGEVQLAWAWNDSVTIMRGENLPIGFQRQAKEGASAWFCGWVNFKNGPGSEDKAYDFVNSWLRHDSAKVLLKDFGYAHSNMAAMKEIPEAELVAADVNPLTSTLLWQTPLPTAMRDRMLAEFELIKSGF